MGCLDNSVLFRDKHDEYKAAVMKAVNLFQSFGFQIHPEKPFLTPKQERDFLSFAKYSKNMTLTLAKQKCNKILENLDLTLNHANNITIRESSKILGMLETAIPVVKNGRLHLFCSTKCKNQASKLSKGSYDCYFKLSSESIVEINWWKATITTSYNAIQNELPKRIIYSDACQNVCWVDDENMSSGSHWSVEESKLHINVLELLAAYHAL